MNFFEAQDTARRNTRLMVVLFVLAVLSLIIITNVLVMAIMLYTQTGVVASNTSQLQTTFDGNMFLGIAVVVSTIIVLGSLFKTAVLKSGGKVVAESLGGRLIPQNSRDPQHRKILNVVEEMAIASGTQVPPVYLMDESSINAFAAGWNPGNAVIGITRGAVNYLSRDELQGVIAHEFSHIFNGDMRLNIRLVGILHGILLLGIMGYYLMRSVRYMGRSRNREGGSLVMAIFMLGLGLTVIGYCGTFFGNWIKAAVSRQREYLADASAVQFTRNPDSIAGALKKIGGGNVGSTLLSPAAPEYSHAYFSQGISSFLFATHPPLEKRILRIDPRWDGKFVVPQRQQPEAEDKPESKAKPSSKTAKSAVVTAATVGTVVSEVLHAIDKIGQPTEAEYQQARDLLSGIPLQIREAAEDPFGVRALIYSFILHDDMDVQLKQLEHLETMADPAVYETVKKLFPEVVSLPARFKLPVIELCFPALKVLSAPQYELFRGNVEVLIKIDNKIDIREWVIQRLVIQQLDLEFGYRKPAVAKYNHIGAVKQEFELILSLVVYAEHKNDDEAKKAFTAGIKSVGATALKIIPKSQINVRELNRAMDKLEKLKPVLKPRVLQAVVAAITVDNNVTITGAELLRTLASCLDSPIPVIEGLQ